MAVLGIGYIKINTFVNGKKKRRTTECTLFLDCMNLLSIGAVSDIGIVANLILRRRLSRKTANLFVKNKFGQKQGQSLYQMKIIAKNSKQDVSAAFATKSQCSLTLWHQRLAHSNNKTILKMAMSIIL